MPAFKELTGKRFGRLHVQGRASRTGKHIYWTCLCDCGLIKIVQGPHLVQGRTKSCGCLQNEISGIRRRTHGLSGTKEFALWQKAKERAKVKGLAFNIEPSDVHIPDACPLLGISLNRANKKTQGPDSPSLDRIDPSKGYTKDNIWVISYQANTMKSNASFHDHQLLVKNWEKTLPRFEDSAVHAT